MATTTVLVIRGAAMRALPPDLFERAGGRLVAHEGGEIVALFDSPTAAVTATVALNRRSGDGGLSSGLDVGDLGPDGAYGRTLAAARLLAEAAGPGRILISELVRLLAPSVEVEALDGGPADLPSGAHDVRWDSTPGPAPLRVIIAEDAVLIRKGLERLLADEGFQVVAGVGDEDALLAAASAEPALDLVITDIRMPPTLTDEGLRAAAELRAARPGLAVLVLSQHIEPAAATTLLASNPTAVGYLLKERVADIDEFVLACHTVAAGGVVIDPLVTEQLMAAEEGRGGLDALSPREREVLERMAAGASNRAIAAALFCSEKTVESHVRSIFTKLDLLDDPDGNRRVAAVVRWLSDGRRRAREAGRPGPTGSAASGG